VRDRLNTYITKREVEEVDFSVVTEKTLAEVLRAQPELLKPLIAASNMGKRAIRKELELELDTYRPKLSHEQSMRLAAFLLGCLPKKMLVETLVALDAYQWVDSEIRKAKGRWEKTFEKELAKLKLEFKKRKFKTDGEEFEIDLAFPKRGDIRLAVDVKSIGHPSDKHKRGDEIVNKAVKFKKQYPKGVFIALVQYPFPLDRDEVERRLRTGTTDIDDVIFAGDDEDSIATAVAQIQEHHRKLVDEEPK